MRLELFTADLTNRHEISHVISCSFSWYYNDIGKFSIVLPLDDYNISIAENDAVLYVVDRALAYEVAEIQIDSDNNQITLNGYTLNNRLNRRVVAASAKVANVETDVYSIVSANLRDMPVSMASSKGLTEICAETTVYGDTLLTALKPILSDVDLGQRATFDYRKKAITWEIYKGTDRTNGYAAVIFAQERGTAQGLVLDKDISEYKNVCYCTASYADKTEYLVTVGTETGENRRELWAECSEAQTADESNAEFEKRVKQYAALQLGSHLDRLGITTDIDGEELGTAYDVGDLVWVVSLRLGLKFKARITGAKITQDQNGQSIKLTIGDPIMTVLR